jgi:tetratricopeptide (TPR) repeat protein
MPFCEECGKPLGPDSVFCGECGAEVVVVGPAPSPPSPPPLPFGPPATRPKKGKLWWGLSILGAFSVLVGVFVLVVYIHLVTQDKTKASYDAYWYQGFNAKEPDQKIFFYTKALEIYPDKEGPYELRGLAYAAKREFDKALQDYNKAVLKNPSVLNYLIRAYIYQQMGENAKSHQDYETAKSMNPNIGSYDKEMANVFPDQ